MEGWGSGPQWFGSCKRSMYFLKFEKKCPNLHFHDHIHSSYAMSSSEINIHLNIFWPLLEILSFLGLWDIILFWFSFYYFPVAFGFVCSFLDSFSNDGVLRGYIFRCLVLFYMLSLVNVTYSSDLATGATPCPLMPVWLRCHWQDHPTIDIL